MASAGKVAGIVSSGFVVGVLILAGCQGQRAEAPAVQPEPADSVPAKAPEEVSNAKSQVSGGGSVLQTSNLKPPTSSETRESVAPNEVKKAPAEAGKPELSGPAVELMLKFVPGQATTYKLTTEYYKSVEWKGSTAAKPASLSTAARAVRLSLRSSSACSRCRTMATPCWRLRSRDSSA